MACSAAPRDSGFLDSTVCASCCARAESSTGTPTLSLAWFKKRRGNCSCTFTAARDASGSAVGAGRGVGEVQQCPSSDRVFAQLCGSCFLFSVSFIFSGCSSGQCVVVFPSSAGLCTVLDSLFVFCPHLPICHAGPSVPFHFSSYFGWFFAFLLWHPSSSTHVSSPLHTVSLFAFLFALCAQLS